MREVDLKNQIKDFLAIKGIFSFPIVQGLGSYRGAPDRVMFYRNKNMTEGKVIFLEIKLPSGKMSEYQLAFEEQCRLAGVNYFVIHSLEELEEVLR